jgi:glyoxylase-like metal-dependent hydrolase (beta-lactamase superfamily II)
MTIHPKLSFLLPATLASVFAFGPVAFGQGASAQSSGMDITGAWFDVIFQDAGRTASGMLDEYPGIPINGPGRIYALTWDPSRLTIRQQQCSAYTPEFLLYGGGNFRFWEDRDPFTQRLISIKMFGQITEGNRTIWMDGRPHPPAWAQHTWMGFSTGKYEGNILTVYTTHLKRAWIRRNGLVQSDQTTVVEHFIRHGDRITFTFIVTDPVYLSEPLIRSTELVRSTRNPEAWLYACDDGEQIVGRPDDKIPHYLYGQYPYLREYADKFRIPLVAALGGPETMYPEYAAKLKDPAANEAAAKAKLVPAPGPQHTAKTASEEPRDGEIHVWPVQGNVYMLLGDGGNIAVQTGEQGALVVDTGAGRLSNKVIAEIRKLVGDKPIQFILNTSYRPDHTGGNANLHAVGADPSLPGSFFAGNNADVGVGATIIAQQNVQNRMSAPTGQASPTSSEGWPTDTFLQGRRRKSYNGEAVEMFWEPNAVTDGDSIVQFRRSDVIVTGDIFTTTQYPFIDLKSGGSLQGEIDALNNILDKTVYLHEEEGGTLIIPGHGRVCDEFEVSEYRDMLAIIRDRVQAMIDKGATLDQVKTAQLTYDYDDRYGATSGPWTTDMFVEAVYTSLKQGRPKASVRK